jgi:hypothetical protein
MVNNSCDNRTLHGRKFLLLGRLQPADVILTLPRELISRGLKVASGGGFSHAAIVLSSLELLESTWDEEFSGVRGTMFSPAQCARVSDEYSELLEITEYSRYEVYRYAPTVETVARFERFKRDIHLLAARHRNKPYASAGGLLQARSRWFKWKAVRRLMACSLIRRLLVRSVSLLLPRHRVEGVFCSMLVATVFHEGGIPMFKSVLVLPHHLSEKLERITDQVIMSGESLTAVAKISDVQRRSPDGINTATRLVSSVMQTFDETITQITEANVAGAKQAGEAIRQHAGGRRAQSWLEKKLYELLRRGRTGS